MLLSEVCMQLAYRTTLPTSYCRPCCCLKYACSLPIVLPCSRATPAVKAIELKQCQKIAADCGEALQAARSQQSEAQLLFETLLAEAAAAGLF